MSSDTGMTGWGFLGHVRSCLPWDTPQNDHDSADARGPGARDHAFRTTFPEPVDPHGEHLRPPHEGAPDELWIEDPNSPKVLDQYVQCEWQINITRFYFLVINY